MEKAAEITISHKPRRGAPATRRIGYLGYCCANITSQKKMLRGEKSILKPPPAKKHYD